MTDSATAPFRPAWWLRGAHAQTIGARMMRSRLQLPFERERFELPDGDFVDLDFAFARPTPDPDRPLVLLLHGLEGSARSGYALQLYHELRALDVDAVGLNFRSCSGEMNRLARFYHSGETGDARQVLLALRERYPAKRLGAVGVSIGANVLLKYLGECSDHGTPVQVAAAISVPFDLAAGAAYLLRPGGRLYASHLIGSLRRKMELKSAFLPPRVDLEAARAARGFRAFDDAATAPLHGFAGADEYHDLSSCKGYLARIRVPTLLIHAYDDPFLPRESVPSRIVEANPSLRAELTQRGGHVGFVTGSVPLRPIYWAERRAAGHLATNLRS